MSRNFKELLEAQGAQKKFLCIGLDPDFEKIPEAARERGTRETLVNFNRAIIDATKRVACAYKPNPAFFEVHGDEGWNALREIIQYIRDEAPEVPVILDAKRGDIGNTNTFYAQAAFDHLRADAITVNPYAGQEGMQPFLDRADKGVFVWCRSSNGGAEEFQDLDVGGMPLYLKVAENVGKHWNKNGNCGLVVGATRCEDMERVRKVAPELPMLIPGIGAQGGNLEESVRCGKDARGAGFILTVGRAVMYASAGVDFAEAAGMKAQEFHGAIMKAL